MISDATRQRLTDAVNNASEYSSGAKRKQLQSTYDKMLDEISNALFKEPCQSRMLFRQKVNKLSSDHDHIIYLKKLLQNQELLFRKDYRDHKDDVENYLTNDISHFLEALNHV